MLMCDLLFCCGFRIFYFVLMWTIFLVLIQFVTRLLLLYIYIYTYIFAMRHVRS